MKKFLILTIVVLVISGCQTLPRREICLIRREGYLAIERFEEALAEGDFTSAQLFAEEIIAWWPNEMVGFALSGKVALKTMRLEEAEEYFSIALRKSERPDEKKIVEDLLFLTRGLRSYAEGDVQATLGYWKQIEDEDLARQIRKEAGRVLGIKTGEGEK